MHLPAGRPILGSRPRVDTPHPKVITHREQIAPGQRGVDFRYLESPKVIVTDSAKTAAIAVTRTAMPTPIPPHATAVMIVSNIAANTNTTGRVNLFVYGSEANATTGGVSGMGAAAVGNMTASGHVFRHTFLAPLCHDKLLWEMTVNGTVNFDYTIYLLGYVVT